MFWGVVDVVVQWLSMTFKVLQNDGKMATLYIFLVSIFVIFKHIAHFASSFLLLSLSR